MFAFRDLLYRHLDELAELAAAEHGKTLTDAKASVTRGIEVVEFVCGIPHLLKGEINENVATDVDTYSMRQPIGVCAGITPFNFPAMVPMWMFPVAIACGDAFVLKPSEKDPSCSLRLAELMTEAGLPPGVLNVVNGDKEAVDTLLTDPGVEAISFVGSTPVGEHVYTTGLRPRKKGAGPVRRQEPHGGHARRRHGSGDRCRHGAAYGSAGERCMAISVAVTVGEEVGDAFVGQLAPRVRALKLGPYNDPEAEMGPHRHAPGLRQDRGLRGKRRRRRRRTGGRWPRGHPTGL